MKHKGKFNRQPRTKFNPSKFGSNYSSIYWKAKPGLAPQGEANQPVIGTLNIAGKQVDLTFSETNKLIEVLLDGQQASKISRRLGTPANGAGSPVGFMEVMSEMHKSQEN